jgi:hypothetical protein
MQGCWVHFLSVQKTIPQVFKNFRDGLYVLVLGQCSDALQDKLKSHRDFDACNQDGIALLLIIKGNHPHFRRAVIPP